MTKNDKNVDFSVGIMKGPFSFFPWVILGVFLLESGGLWGSRVTSAAEGNVAVVRSEPPTLQIRSRIPERDAADLFPARGDFPFTGYDGYDFRIRFVSEPFTPSTFVAIRLGKKNVVSGELARRIEAVERRLADAGIPILSDAFFSEETAGKDVVLYGVFPDHFDPATVEKSLFFDPSDAKPANSPRRVLFFRDLSFPANFLAGGDPSGEKLTNARFAEADRWRIGLEEGGLSSVSSGDLLGSDDFHSVADRRRSVVFIVSDDHYHADKTVPIFAEASFLAEEKRSDNWRVGVIHGEGTARFRPVGLLDSADVAVIFVRRLAIPAELSQKLRGHLAAGKGLVGLRTASHAFAPNETPEAGFVLWPELDRDVLGGNYHNHGANAAGTEVKNVENAKNSPAAFFLDGLSPVTWSSQGSLYFTSPIAEDAQLLQTGTASGRTEPLTWIRYFGPNKAPVAYSGLGHPDDFNRPVFRQLLTRLIEWAATRPNESADR